MGAIPYCDSGALFAHGLLRNRKETEVSHSPTVSRLFDALRQWKSALCALIGTNCIKWIAR